MGAVVDDRQDATKNFSREKLSGFRAPKRARGNLPPSLLPPINMRPRLPFPQGRLPPPCMGPIPPPGMRPPPSMRCRMPMGQRGPVPPGMRPPPPNMRLGPGMRPPPPHLLRPIGPPMMPPHGPRGPRFHARLPPPPPIQNKLRRIHKGRIMKKRRPSLKDVDLTKQWVTEQIKEEFCKKDNLLKLAKSTQKSSDWSQYRDQREKCSKIYNTTKLEYIGKHPEEDVNKIVADLESLNNEKSDQATNIGGQTSMPAEPVTQSAVSQNNESSYTEPTKTRWAHLYDYDELEYTDESDEGADEDRSLSCEPCEKDFYTHEAYERHVSQHRMCGIDGCTFNADSNVIEKHIQVQHLSGLYEKIRTAKTPEDIKRWIQDRKNKYPTAHNIELRYKKQKELFNRGERIGPKNQRFQTRQGFQRNHAVRKSHVRKHHKKTHQQVSTLIDDKYNWNGNMFPFQGTQYLYEVIKTEENTDEFDDSEWNSVSTLASEETFEKATKNTKTIENNLWHSYSGPVSEETFEKATNNTKTFEKPIDNTNTLENISLSGLGLLMGAYSDSEQSEDESKAIPINLIKLENPLQPLTNPLPQTETNSDDDGPREEKILYEKDLPDINRMNDIKVELQTKAKNENKNEKNSKKRTAKETKIVTKSYFKKRRLALLEKMLESEIRHERNILLQCVRYVVKKDFFDIKNAS